MVTGRGRGGTRLEALTKPVAAGFSLRRLPDARPLKGAATRLRDLRVSVARMHNRDANLHNPIRLRQRYGGHVRPNCAQSGLIRP
jgi:hypothetical protein